MSPVVGAFAPLLSSFPRVSGDEPENPANTIGTTKFSPRERG